MTSILEQIAAYKQLEVADAKHKMPIARFLDESPSPVRDFVGALKGKNPAIIAEIKRASPSKGIIRKDFDVATIAEIYANNGANCLSVLTDMHFFQGAPKYLANAKAHCDLPVLRKDFIIDAYQIHESRALGADCILLIVALLDDQQLLDYCQLAQELNMAVRVESHSLDELTRACKLPTLLMGINNRSLHTFTTDLQCSIRLKEHVPSDKIIISESGINTHEDIVLMQSHGIHAFLIGESLMRAEDIASQLHRMIHGDGCDDAGR